MERRHFIKAGIAATTGGAFLGANKKSIAATQSTDHGQQSQMGTGNSKKMNHVFFIVDDLNLAIGCYGHPAAYTPNIDRLAARGTRFANGYCPYPLCGPSRTAMLTGQRPESFPMPNNEVAWRDVMPDLRSLPQIFREAGYYTGGFGKLYHHGIQKKNLPAWQAANPTVPAFLAHEYNDAPSWDESAVTEMPWHIEDKAKGPEQLIDGRAHGGTSLHSIRATNPEVLPDYLIANQAIDFLKKQSDPESRIQHPESHTPDPESRISDPESRISNPESQSFFLGIGFHKPHVPFIAPEKWWAFYDSLDVESLRPPTWFQPAELPPGTLKQDRFHRDMDEAQRIHCYKGYLACVSWMDEQVGRVIQALEAEGLSATTTISFVADHGYHIGEQAQWDKMMLLDPSLRVPLILAGPGIPAGQVCEATAESLDLFPTLCALHGIDPKQSVAGKSLVPYLQDPAKASTTPAFGWVEAGEREGWTIRTDRYRYGLTRYDGGQPEPYLFDYQADPEETTNLTGRPEVAAIEAELAKRLNVHYAIS